MSKLNSILERFAEEVRAECRAELLRALEPQAKSSAGRVAGPVTERIPGAKRDPKELNDLMYALHKYVMQHPGQRIEQIGLGMNATTKELVLPTRKLLDKRLLVTTGQKRATAYWAK